MLTVNHTNITPLSLSVSLFVREHEFSDVQMNTDITASNLWFIRPPVFYMIWLNLDKSLVGTVPDLFLMGTLKQL